VSDNPVPPPDFDEPPKWMDTSLAKAEDSNFDNEGRLRGQKERNDLLWLRIYGWVVVSMMIIFSLLFLTSLISWAWHYTMPLSLHWLTDDQLSKIQSVIFSGSLGGIVSIVAQKQLSK
jgi:hypothetical protein